MNQVNVIQFGYGHLGRWHAQKCEQNEMSHLVAIVEMDKSKHEIIRQEFKNTLVTDSMDDLKQLSFDACVIVTPTSTHFELAKWALEQNKHVFVEKPVCANLKETLDLKNFLNDKKIFQVGHSERCHACLEDIKPLIGPQSVFEFKRVAPFKGRATDVSVVEDLMIHDLDLWNYLLDGIENSDEIHCHFKTNHTLLEKAADDVRALFSRGNSKALFHVSRVAAHEQRSLEILSGDYTIFIDLFKLNYKIMKKGELFKESSYEKRDHLMVEHQAFYESILNQGPVFVSYNDALKAMKLIDLTYQQKS